jgi:SOS response regulatory protein OraA/RecX
LSLRGFSASVISSTLASLEHESLLDERSALEGFLLSRRGRYAPARIRRELEHRGFDSELVREGLEGFSEEEEQALLETLFRRRRRELSGLAPERRRKRLFDFLERRGFARSKIFDLLGEAADD